jgi:protein-S-isoprenylcysteine O-methyltransferase Ste14
MKLPTPPDLPPRPLGSVFVALQFGLILALVALALPALSDRGVPLGAWVVLAASAALGLWAVASHPGARFNIHPEPRAGGELVERGPYRWVRHPMYTSVIGFGLACAWVSGTGLAAAAAWACLTALAAVLWAKAGLEERWLVQQHPGYAAYRSRTRRFLPKLL